MKRQLCVLYSELPAESILGERGASVSINARSQYTAVPQQTRPITENHFYQDLSLPILNDAQNYYGYLDDA